MINQNIEPLSQSIYDKAERFLSNYKVSTFPSETELWEKINAFLKLEGDSLYNRVGIIISLSSWERERGEHFYKREVRPFPIWKKYFCFLLRKVAKNHSYMLISLNEWRTSEFFPTVRYPYLMLKSYFIDF